MGLKLGGKMSYIFNVKIMIHKMNIRFSAI